MTSKKLIVTLITVALLCSTAAAATASSISITESAFNSNPMKVFDTGNTTDSKWTLIPYTDVTFLADAANDTL